MIKARTQVKEKYNVESMAKHEYLGVIIKIQVLIKRERDSRDLRGH